MKPKILHRERFEKYLEVFNKLKKKYTGINSRYSVENKAIRKAWNERMGHLEDSEIDGKAKDMVKALYAACKSDHHTQANWKWITPEFLLRQDKIDYWLNEYISNHHVKRKKQKPPTRYV